MADETKIIGGRIIRKDAVEKITGKAMYIADHNIRGMYHCAFVRSAYHHARITQINIQAARSMPGVIAVLTAEDIPGERKFGSLIQDQPPLAFNKVVHIGQPVVMIIAETRELAFEASLKIAITYEELPAVFDPIEALEANAPVIHTGGNLVCQYNVQDGELAIGLAEADIILEKSFKAPRVSPAYMETETSMAVWHEEDQSITVWVSSQHPFEDRRQIANVLGVPIEKVQVKSAVIGGAFGGKEDSSIAILAALGAWKTKHCVKIVNNRSDSFLAHPKRHPAILQYKVGAKNDGTITALQAVIHIDTGAFASYGPAVGGLMTEMATGSYRIPHVSVQTFIAYTNGVFCGAMRGFGSPQAHFALESTLDSLACELSLSPVDIRRKNIIKPGDRTFTQVLMNDSARGLEKCLEIASETIEKLQNIQPADGKLSGVGMSLAAQTMGLGANVPDDSTHRLEWLPDGTVQLFLGAPDLGQGLSAASEQIIAEVLGIPYTSVKAVPIDTKHTPNGGTSCASRMTYMAGNAVITAAEMLISKLISETASMLNISTDRLQYKKGFLLTDENEKIPVKEFTSRLADNGISLTSTATFSFPYPADTTPQHLPIGMPHVLYCFGAQIARVEIDPELGTVEVKDIVAVHDVGKIINRLGVEGQIEGGVITGMGYALMESLELKNTAQWTDSFTEYLIPTSMDMPNIETIILEYPERSGPLGAKGIGEITLVPTAPAITNAVFQATGKQICQIPIQPEALLSQN